MRKGPRDVFNFVLPPDTMSNTTVAVNGSPILNPYAPLSYLPTDQAYQVRVSRYILIGTCGAFIWDIINNIKNDYLLASKHRIRLQTIIYFISKLTSLGYILGSTILETAPISSCMSSGTALEVLYSLAIPSTSLLFFFRIRAVFNTDPWVVSFFGALWLAVLAGCLTTVVGVTSENIGPTLFCIAGDVKPYTAAATIIPLVNDTVVFCAITWRLWTNSYAGGTLQDGVRVFVCGDYLPTFSRSMLQDGQAYYLATVTANILTVIMLCNSSLTDIYRTMFTIPNIAVMNIMACRVYRNTMFVLFNDNPTSTIPIRGVTGSIISLEVRGSRKKKGVSTTLDTTERATLNDDNVITITRTVERFVEDCRAGEKDKKNLTDISHMV